MSGRGKINGAKVERVLRAAERRFRDVGEMGSALVRNFLLDLKGHAEKLPLSALFVSPVY